MGDDAAAKPKRCRMRKRPDTQPADTPTVTSTEHQHTGSSTDHQRTGSPSSRPPTTYSELSRHPNAINVPPDLTVPPLASNSPWHHDPVPPEPPSDVGALCGNTVGVALGGASPSKREEPAK
jgi:hypothetical protein